MKIKKKAEMKKKYILVTVKTNSYKGESEYKNTHHSIRSSRFVISISFFSVAKG